MSIPDFSRVELGGVETEAVSPEELQSRLEAAAAADPASLGGPCVRPRARATTLLGPRESRRYMYNGPPALGPVPDKPSPPKGCTPTTAPTMLRLT